MVPNFEALAQAGIRGLRAYDPGHDLVAMRRKFGEDVLVELGSNENSYGPTPAARSAALEALFDLHRYPDPLGGDLKRALARHHGVDVAQVLLGNGSHELLMQFAQAFAGPGLDVVASRYGFAVYALAAQAAGATLKLAEAYSREHAMPRGHDLDAILAAVTPATRLVYLANPNNPTGTWFASETLERFLRALPGDVLVVVDEAYAEYVTDPALPSAVALLPLHPNLIVARTFSKVYALAGLRVGYALAHPELIAVMERLRSTSTLWACRLQSPHLSTNCTWLRCANAMRPNATCSARHCVLAGISCIRRRPISCWSSSAPALLRSKRP